MSVDDRTRAHLHRRLADTIGPEAADTLMTHLPPVGASELATRDDLAALGASLRSEMAVSAATLRSEMADLRTEMHTGMSGLRAEMGIGFADLRSEMQRTIAHQSRWMLTVSLAWGSVLIAAGRLLS
jgi:hypothetical protein